MQSTLSETNVLRTAKQEAERLGKLAETELVSYKERCQILEKELEIKGKSGMGVDQKQMRDMEFELK